MALILDEHRCEISFGLILAFPQLANLVPLVFDVLRAARTVQDVVAFACFTLLFDLRIGRTGPSGRLASELG